MTLEMMKERQKELNFTDKQMAILTNTPESTFHRRWNSDGQSLTYDFINRCCLVLGLSIDEDVRTPTEDSKARLEVTEEAHEETMRIIAEKLNGKNEQIEILNDRVETLRRELEQKIQLLHQLHESRDERLSDKNELIKELKDNARTIQERADRQIEDMRKRMDTKNKYIVVLFTCLVVMSLVAMYCIIDAYNGDWGFIRYEALLELLPDSFGASYAVESADDFVGLWAK